MPNKFLKLKNYISKKMSMAHIYQPLMLIELIKGNGKASARNISKSFLSYDETQIDYYKKITTLMPFKYLSKHLSEIKKSKNTYLFDQAVSVIRGFINYCVQEDSMNRCKIKV